MPRGHNDKRPWLSTTGRKHTAKCKPGITPHCTHHNCGRCLTGERQRLKNGKVINRKVIYHTGYDRRIHGNPYCVDHI